MLRHQTFSVLLDAARRLESADMPSLHGRDTSTSRQGHDASAETSASGAKCPRVTGFGPIPSRQPQQHRAAQSVSTSLVGGSRTQARYPTPTCFYCQQLGHKITECPQRQVGSSSQTQGQSQRLDMVPQVRDQVTCF